MTHNSTDFHLPDEILSVIPTDPYEQLDLARKITSMAIASRVSKLELETVRLRQKITEKDRMVYELEEKVMQLEQAFQESESQLRVVLEENVQLSKERDLLAATTKKLNRDLSKLETFKRQLMQSLNNDNLSQAETVDIGTCDHSVSKKDAEINSFQASNLVSGSAESENSNIDGLRNAGRRFSMPQYITPRYTPTGTPNLVSTGGSPRGYSAAGSPRISSRATSPPTKVQFEGQTGLSPWYSSSQQSSAANSPPRGRPLPGRTPRIDGKEFFRQARSRLSYEQFSAFLANIKELNSQKQSREDTLKKAEEIFGRDNKDLYVSFQGLLGRNANYN